MKRRDLFRTAAALAATPQVLWAQANAPAVNTNANAAGQPFKLRYAPHFGQFSASAGNNPLDQLKYMADQGFRAFEDNGLKGRSKEEQERIGKEAVRLGLEPGIFVFNDDGHSNPILTSGDQGRRDKFLANARDSVEVAKRMGTKYATLVVGTNQLNLHRDYQFANVVESLKRAAEICEPSGLIMVMEPLNIYRDHPNFFVASNATAYALCKAVRSPSLKILFDIYHTQINEGNIIPNIDQSWSEIAYFQTGDTPGRQEPGTGEINYRNVFRHIHRKGYTGILGMEHGKSKGGKEGEAALIQAYRDADAF
jgi:hydroxypyruvate isomerase